MDPASVDLVIKVISSLGFPIFVAIWLLVRTDKLLSENTKVLQDLKAVIEKLCEDK